MLFTESEFNGEIHKDLKTLQATSPTAHILAPYTGSSVTGIAKGVSMQDFTTAFILDNPGIAGNQVKAMWRVAGKLLTPSRYGADYYQVIWSSKQHPQFHIGDHLSTLSANAYSQ